MNTTSANTSVLEDYKDQLFEYYNTNKYEILSFHIQRVTGVLSMMGSLFIVQDILRNQRRRNRTRIGRLQMKDKVMLCLSSMDILYSFFGPVLGTLPVPAGEAYGARGTPATCSIAGLLVGYGFCGSTLYSAALAVCYLLMVRYRWNEAQLHRRWVKFALLPFPVLLFTVYGIITTALQSNSFKGSYCSIFTPYPLGCDNDNKYPVNEVLWSRIIFSGDPLGSIHSF